MHDILSYVQPPNSGALYACGFSWTDATLEHQYKKWAGVFKMDSDSGEILFMKQWGKPVAQTDTPTPAASTKDERTDANADSNICRSIAYDVQTRQVVFLMEYVQNDLRPRAINYAGFQDRPDASYNNADLVVVRMDESGNMISGLNVNMQKASITLGIGEQSLFIHKQHLIFAGQSFGYYTKF
jgi:hypothetical protein